MSFEGVRIYLISEANASAVYSNIWHQLHSSVVMVDVSIMYTYNHIHACTIVYVCTRTYYECAFSFITGESWDHVFTIHIVLFWSDHMRGRQVSPTMHIHDVYECVL